MQPGSFPERENIYRVEFFCLDFYALRVERVREKYLLCLFYSSYLLIGAALA